MNKVYYRQLVWVRFFKRDRRTGEVRDGLITNRDDMSEKELVEWLNQSDPNYEYDLGNTIMDNVYFKDVRLCRVFQRDKVTGEVREVNVTNRNGLS